MRTLVEEVEVDRAGSPARVSLVANFSIEREDTSMNILLSAYSCLPDKGSEHGVGWNWALQLERAGHSVTVITRKKHEGPIDAYRKMHPELGLRFLYVDLPAPFPRLKTLDLIPTRVYYFLWQCLAYRAAKAALRQTSFDICQHITLSDFRIPSFLPFLPVPAVLGPLGGGDEIPESLISGFAWRSRTQERLRKWANRALPRLLGTAFVSSRAKLIIARTRNTGRYLNFANATPVLEDVCIGFDSDRLHLEEKRKDFHPTRAKFLYVGRFEYWKGTELLLRAFAKLRTEFPDIHLSLLGSGVEKERLKRVAAELGLRQGLEWHEQLSSEQLSQLYREHDIFVFPSLREAGGMVLVEALSFGLPAIGFALGGPDLIINDHCGVRVPVLPQTTTEQAIDALAAAMKSYVSGPEKFYAHSSGARLRARSFTWDSVFRRVWGAIEEELQESSIQPGERTESKAP